GVTLRARDETHTRVQDAEDDREAERVDRAPELRLAVLAAAAHASAPSCASVGLSRSPSFSWGWSSSLGGPSSISELGRISPASVRRRFSAYVETSSPSTAEATEQTRRVSPTGPGKRRPKTKAVAIDTG